LNPFELARTELTTPWARPEVESGLDALLAQGFQYDGFAYRVFGRRQGAAFSFSLGLPLLGGGEPVLRGRVTPDAAGCRLVATVGARLELALFGWFWILVTLLGAGVQLSLQCTRVLREGASWSAVTAVLPGIALLMLLTFGGIAFWRWRTRPRVAQLLAALARATGASLPSITHPSVTSDA
jgi:hypothetical protein